MDLGHYWVVTLTVAAAASIGYLATRSIPPEVALFALALVGTAVLTVSGRSSMQLLRARGTASYLGSAVLSFVMIVSILIPSVTYLTSGGTSTKLDDFGIVFSDPGQQVSRSVLISLLALLAFVAGEQLARRYRQKSQPLKPSVDIHVAFGVYIVLLAISALRLAIFGPPTDTSILLRGTEAGAGVRVMMFWALPLAIALAIIYRSFATRWVTLLNIVLILVLLIPAATRSPLTLIACAVFIRFLQRLAIQRVRLRFVVVFIIGAYVGISLLSAVSSYRGELRTGASPSFAAHLFQELQNATIEQKLHGLDTLDGLMLTNLVEPHRVGATPADPLKALAGFIPSQVWADKPEWVAPQVAATYLGWNSGGIFYGGQGWAYLVFGGYAGVAAWFALMGAILYWAFSRWRLASVPGVLLIYFVLRFGAAGDAFNMFHVLMLVALYLVAYYIAFVLVRWLPSQHGQRPAAIPTIR